MTAGKTIALTRQTFVGKIMSLLFNILSSLVITFLPRSKHLLISWLQSWSSMILEPENKVCHCFHCFPIYLPWSDGTNAMMLVLWMLNFKPTFSLSSFTFFKRFFHFHQEAFCHKGGVICISEVIDISPGNLDSIIQHSISRDILCT